MQLRKLLEAEKAALEQEAARGRASLGEEAGQLRVQLAEVTRDRDRLSKVGQSASPPRFLCIESFIAHR